MQIRRRAVLGAAMLAAPATAGALRVRPGTWPDRPIRFVIGGSAGGVSDILVRILENRLREKLGQPLVLDPRPGAGGMVGAEVVARSPADGYSFYINHIASHGIGPSLYKRLAFDPLKDLPGVARLASMPNVLIVKGDSPHRTVPELVAFIRANPEKATFSSAGTGTSSHLSGVLFGLRIGVETTHVPYRGTAPSMAAVLNGEVLFAIDNAPAIAPAGAGRDAARAGGLHRRARLHHAGAAEPAGAGRGGFRRGVLVRHRRARGDAAADRRADGGGAGRGAERPGLAQRYRDFGAEPKPLGPAEYDAYHARRGGEMGAGGAARPALRLTSRRRRRCRAAAPAGRPAARAQPAWPDRPLRFIVSAQVGGVSDILVRIFESRLRERLGQPLYVEPRPGGGGLIAAETAMRANDAHSFTVNHIASHGIGPSLYRNRGGFDPLRDMPGVCRVCAMPNVLIVRSELPIRSVADLVAYIRANPGKANFSSAGSGTSSHLSGILFGQIMGVEVTHVPYRGTAPSMLAVLNGEVLFNIDNAPTSRPHVQSGALRAIGVSTGAAREDDAGPADPGGAGRGGLRRGVLVRLRRARGDAGAGGGEAGRRAAGCRGRSRHRRPPGRDRRRALAARYRRLQRLHAGGGGALGAGGAGLGRYGGLRRLGREKCSPNPTLPFYGYGIRRAAGADSQRERGPGENTFSPAF